MNVLVLSHIVPFVPDGTAELCSHLVHNLKSAGLNAEAFLLPFSGQRHERLVEEMYVARSLRLWDVDRLIALTFPAYLVPHHGKVAWVVSLCRDAYEAQGNGISVGGISVGGPLDTPAGTREDELRSMVQQADKLALLEARSLYAASRAVVDGLRRSSGIDARLLPIPLADPELFCGGESCGYILATGRVNDANRQALLIDALSLCPGEGRLVIAGPPDTEADGERLVRLVAKHGLTDRVTLDLRVLSRKDVADLVNGALAVACLNLRADRASGIVPAAMQAGKPVIGTTDSQGAVDHVVHEHTGLLVEPAPEAVAWAMASLFASPGKARAYGAQGHSAWAAVGATWGRTIDTLLS